MLVQAGERKAREVAHSELALCSAAFAVGLGKNKIEGRFLAPWLQQVRFRLTRQLFPAARMQKLLSSSCGWLRVCVSKWLDPDTCSRHFVLGVWTVQGASSFLNWRAPLLQNGRAYSADASSDAA